MSGATVKSHIARALVTLAVLCGQSLNAQELPQQIPEPDLDFGSALPVAEINAQCEVIVEIEGDKDAAVLAGVVAPREPDQRILFREFLTRLLMYEEVVIREVAEEPDQESRTQLAYVFRSPDGLFVNVEVVRQGYAKAKLDRKSEHYSLFRDAQRRARRADLGVWGSTPPPAAKPAPRAAAVTGKGADTGATTVYVTKYGKKYHRQECRHLRKSSRALTLEEAIEKGYGPCKTCKPPTGDDP